MLSEMLKELLNTENVLFPNAHFTTQQINTLTYIYTVGHLIVFDYNSCVFLGRFLYFYTSGNRDEYSTEKLPKFTTSPVSSVRTLPSKSKTNIIKTTLLKSIIAVRSTELVVHNFHTESRPMFVFSIFW